MILSRKHRFAFIKTIKTAGTSVEIFLSKFAGPDDLITYLPPPDEAIRRELGSLGPQNCFNPGWKQLLLRMSGKSRRDAAYAIHHNISAADLQSLFPNEWKDLLSFTIVRNPFDRAISKFFNDHKDEADTRREQARPHTREEINSYIVTLPDADLTNWHLYADANGVAVGEIVRYETLERDLARVLHKIGLSEPVELPRAKGSWRLDRRHYSDVLDDKARARIEKAAAQEIETFGYIWERAG